MEFYENDIRSIELRDENDSQQIAEIGQALSSPTRVEILRLLNGRPYLMSEIATTLNIQPSSAAFHLKMLENAGLINTEYSTLGKGSSKWYSYGPRDIILRLRPLEGQSDGGCAPYTADISIGDYIDAQLSAESGFATDRKVLTANNPKNIFHPERHNTQIIWNSFYGHVTYAIPNSFTSVAPLSEILLSVELCSETHGYNNDYPSDITFWINSRELCTWTCPGDFGDKYGLFTPSWWFPESTKYGLLTTIGVSNMGVTLNGRAVNKLVRLTDLALEEGSYITFKIGVKKDAVHQGGFNIFGEKFGNFNQAIRFTAAYKKN